MVLFSPPEPEPARTASTVAAMTRVLPVPGGPCTSTTRVCVVAPPEPTPRFALIKDAAARTASLCGGFRPAIVDAHASKSAPSGAGGRSPAFIPAKSAVCSGAARLGLRNADAAPANPPARHVASKAAISRRGGVSDATREMVTAAPRLETARNTPSRRSRSSGAFKGPPPFPVSHLVVGESASSTRHTRILRRMRESFSSADDFPPTLAPDQDFDPEPVSTPSTTPNAWYRCVVRREPCARETTST